MNMKDIERMEKQLDELATTPLGELQAQIFKNQMRIMANTETITELMKVIGDLVDTVRGMIDADNDAMEAVLQKKKEIEEALK